MVVLGEIFISVNIFPSKTATSLHKFDLGTMAF